MAKVIKTEEDAEQLTNNPNVVLEQALERRTKIHRKFSLVLGIVGAVLLVGAAITVLPFGAAAFTNAAWWAVNGSLTGLGIIGVGSAIVAKALEYKNRKALKLLKANRDLRNGKPGQGKPDQRTKERLQKKVAELEAQYGKYLKENEHKAMTTPLPELTEQQRPAQTTQANTNAQNEEFNR